MWDPGMQGSTLNSSSPTEAFILTGAYMVQVEFLLNRVFGLSDSFIWAFYPLAACVIIGGLLLIVGMCKPLRESLYKKFFI